MSYTFDEHRGRPYEHAMMHEQGLMKSVYGDVSERQLRNHCYMICVLEVLHEMEKGIKDEANAAAYYITKQFKGMQALLYEIGKLYKYPEYMRLVLLDLYPHIRDRTIPMAFMIEHIKSTRKSITEMFSVNQ